MSSELKSLTVYLYEHIHVKASEISANMIGLLAEQGHGI